MRRRLVLLTIVAVILLRLTAHPAPFVVFPKAVQLPSPDGRYVVRNSDRQAPLADYVGVFHSLFLEDNSTGRIYKLCDYVGVAAVAWSGNDHVVVTQYVSKRTSRAIVYAATDLREVAVIDVPSLIYMVPVELRPQLRENDHLFIEATGVEYGMIALRVWGYGKHDPKGFRWHCGYDLAKNVATCEPASQP